MFSHSLKRKKSEVHLDLTPLIDVVFLLLIFFMVSTSFEKTHWLEVKLPQIDESNQAATTDPKQIVIGIDNQGKYFINDETLAIHNKNDLRQAMEKTVTQDSVVIIHGDAHAPHGAVIELLDVLGQLKITNIQIAAVGEGA